MASLDIWFGISNNCGDVLSNRVEQNTETDEEHNEDCVEEEFQLDSIKFDRDGEKGREVLVMGNYSIII